LCKRQRKTPVSYRKPVGNCILLESNWSRTDSTTEAIAKSISTITRATANSKRNITQLIPQKASPKQQHQTPVSYWKLVGNCVLRESGWSTTYSTKEAIAKSIMAITRAIANSKANITRHIPQNASETRWKLCSVRK
jgi:hypothetical protein